MSYRYESPAALAAKIDWEGGLYEFILGYGVDIDELPEGTPDDVIAAFTEIINTQNAANVIIDWLPDPSEYEYD